MTTTKSAKSSATAFIESMGVESNTPFDIVSAMEEAFMSREPLHIPVQRNITRKDILQSMEDVLSPMDDFVNKRILAAARWKQKTMIFTNFGRWLEDDEKRIINSAKKGLEQVDERLSAAYYAVDKIKSRRQWKAEQKRNQNASHNGPNVKAAKTVINGKAVWEDAQVHELPPIANGKAHEPAYYAIKLPDGTVVSLAKSTQDFPAKLNKYPSQAMQNIAARLGITMRGGDTAILNHLLGEEPIVSNDEHGQSEANYKWLPSYTSVWQGVWVVYVGWRLNPKITASSYWVDANDELTRMNPNGNLPQDHESYQAPLTLSQLDYHLLSESSDLEVKNEEGEVVDFMNEEEEFLGFAPQRESGETFIDFSKYCEDDEEMELFQACSAVVERSEGGLTVGDLESTQFINDYVHKGVLRTQHSLNKMRAIENPDDKLLQIISNMEANLVRLNRLDDLWNKFVGTHHEPETMKQATFGAKGDFREPLKCQPFMSDEPLNQIEAPLAREVSEMPEHAAVTYTWLNALSPKLMAKREREARKGQVFQSIKQGSLAAELAFAATLNRLLSPNGALRA